MYSLGTDVIVQLSIGEPLTALMLLCRDNLFDTDVIVQKVRKVRTFPIRPDEADL